MIKTPLTETDVADLLTQFGNYTQGKGAETFLNSKLAMVATNIVLLKTQQEPSLPNLLQLVAWGVFLAEKGEAHLTLALH